MNVVKDWIKIPANLLPYFLSQAGARGKTTLFRYIKIYIKLRNTYSIKILLTTSLQAVNHNIISTTSISESTSKKHND